MKRLLIIGGILTFLSACNTVAGVGEDITGVARAAQGGISAGVGGNYQGGQF